MNSDELIIKSSIIREHIYKNFPDIIVDYKKEWKDRIYTTSKHNDFSKPRVYVFYNLSSFEDSNISICISQLLDIKWIDAAIILILPNKLATELTIRRMREYGIEQLFYIIESSKLPDTVSRLDNRSILSFITTPSILTADYITNLKLLIKNHFVNAINGKTNGATLWRAGHWKEYNNSSDIRNNKIFAADSALSVSIKELYNPEETAPIKEKFKSILQDFYAEANKSENSFNDAPSSHELAHSNHKNSININLPPDCDPKSSEIIIYSTSSNHFSEPHIIFRRDLSLFDSSERKKIPIPLSFVGKKENTLRIILKSHTKFYSTTYSISIPPTQLEPSMVTCYLNRGGGGNPMIRAFADGIGCELRYAEDEIEHRPGVPVVWGILRGSDQIIKRAKEAGQYFFYIDHAYFNRGHGVNYRITRNAYEAGQIRKCPHDRISNENIILNPWQRTGRNILICPPTEYFMAAHDCYDWLDQTLDILKNSTNKKLVIRRKPKAGEAVEPLNEALQNAYALVTHSSNIAIESVLAGTPVFVSPYSAAAPVGLSDMSKIETPVYPDRKNWLAHLAYSQFSLDEIKSGKAWQLLMEHEERELVS